MTVDLTGMNESQLAAVNWQDGALLVLAGPGSGKTRVVTYRIARLIESSQESRFRVLAVTFTNKAAAEMRTRIDELVSRGRERVNITTFHSLAADILRQHGSHIGLRPDFMILSDQADREAVLAEAISEVASNDHDVPGGAQRLLPIMDRLLDDCVPPEAARDVLKGMPNAELISAIYDQYRGALVAANQMDFASLLAATVDLLEKRPAIARQIRRTYAYVCVDEFQDTNAAQYRLLVQLISESDPNLFVVADDDQVIYQWNGASPARLRELQARFQMRVVQLPVNFRCPPEVVALANKLIRHNDDRSLDKASLTSHKQQGEGRTSLKKFDSFLDEISWLAEHLSKLPPGERSRCVVLSRRKKLLEEALTRFQQTGVPAHLALRKNEFQSAPFRWLHGMLRLANARHDGEQLRRLARAFAQLEGIRIEPADVRATAAAETQDYLRVWLSLALARDQVEQATKELLHKTTLTLADRLDYWAFVQASLSWFQEVEELPRDPAETAFDEYGDELAVWDALVDEIGRHYSLPDLSLHKFLQELDLRAKEVPPPPKSVRCLTIHGSKGTEFKHVFLIGLVEDELPSWAARQKGDDSDEMREERRNCFVAITRAEATLTLTYSDEYFGWPKDPSRFLFEMELLK